MRYISTLIAVKDLAASLRFYREALGMEVVQSSKPLGTIKAGGPGRLHWEG